MKLCSLPSAARIGVLLMLVPHLVLATTKASEKPKEALWAEIKQGMTRRRHHYRQWYPGRWCCDVTTLSDTRSSWLTHKRKTVVVLAKRTLGRLTFSLATPLQWEGLSPHLLYFLDIHPHGEFESLLPTLINLIIDWFWSTELILLEVILCFGFWDFFPLPS